MRDHEINSLVRHQYGLITRQQALATGMSKRMIDSRLARGEWQRWDRGVYLHSSHKGTLEAHLLSGCLATGGFASHASAARLHDLEGIRPGRPHITVPDGRSVRRRNLQVHESTQFDQADVRTVRGIPTSGLERTLLDLAGHVAYQTLEIATDSARRDHDLDLDQLTSVWAQHRCRGRNGTGPMGRYLDEHYGDDHLPLSGWGTKASDVFVAFGLPAPVLEHRIEHNGTFIAQVDCAYPAAKVAIELDSVRWHFNKQSFFADPQRRNRLILAGWTLLCFTWQDFQRRPRQMCESVAAARLLLPAKNHRTGG